MGFFKKIFRRGKSKKNKSKNDGAFLPDHVPNHQEDMIRKPSFPNQSSKSPYNPYPTPEISHSDSRSLGRKSRGSRDSKGRSHDSSYGSSYDSREETYPAPGAVRPHPGHRQPQNPNSFRADFSGFNNENNANYANQMVPHHSNKNLNYDQVQQFERQQQAQQSASYIIAYTQPPQSKMQLTRLPNGQLVAKNAVSPSMSSEFDLSTDVDDNEYNTFREIDTDQFNSILGSPKSGMSNEDPSMRPGVPQRKSSRSNKLYMSTSESEYESFQDVGENHRSRHYFSDSEGGTPKSRESAIDEMPNTNFTFEDEFNTSAPLQKKSSPPPQDVSVLGMNSVELSSSSEGPSPRSMAIQEAQKLRNETKASQGPFSPQNNGDKVLSPKDTISPPTNRPSEGIISNLGDFQKNNLDSRTPQHRSQSVADPTSPVSELLAKAKQRRDNRKGASSGSVSSAPNQNGRRVPRPLNSASATAREKLEMRRREKKEWLKSNDGNSDDDSKNGQDKDNESWLYNEVSGALGPQGIQADLESLGERSHRSKTSVGARSHRSHRSSSRRQRGSDASVGSRHSRASRGSRASRYSIKSTKSHLSAMSVESRSVANDLIRLEMQLAMVGANKNGENTMKKQLESDAMKKGITGLSVARGSNGSVGPSGGSVGGRSRSSGSKSSRPKSMIPRRIKGTVKAPPGKLGIILANRNDARGTVVSGVRTTSVLAEKVSPGDRIIAIDGEDVSRMTVTEITAIMARKSDYDRILTIVTTAK